MEILISNAMSVLREAEQQLLQYIYKTLLLTDTQVSRLFKAFAKGSSANIKLSKPQVCKMG